MCRLLLRVTLRYRDVMNPDAPYRDLAAQYHVQLPPHLRAYLNARVISDTIIDRFLVGFDGTRITIPIPDRTGTIAFFRLARVPDGWGPKMLSQPGTPATLYGWEHVHERTDALVICEGEFDRLVLEGQGIPAVTGTGGAATFLPAWAEVLAVVPHLYVCYDRDAAGRAGTRRVAQLLAAVRVVELPDEVGLGGDVTDYFVKLQRTREDFLALMDGARPYVPEPVPATPPPPHPRTRIYADAARAKEGVRLEDLVAGFVDLKRSGDVWRARCPFHDEREPSFIVYPGSQTYHCFGCQAHGDAISFLRTHEHLRFGEAVEVLRRLAHP